MAYLHYRIRIPIAIMATLYYVELFTLNKIMFRFPTQLPGTGMDWDRDQNRNMLMQINHYAETVTQLHK